jgi:uroporphyrinogen III methyltransferase / synthase
MPVKTNNGICHLAGAGPGDPGLVTLRAKECIEQADVILHDSLVNPEILKWARPDAEIIFAGKSPDEHKVPQDEINALLIEKTRAGKRVVRLKGGDPFLFGRGGEEAEALANAGLRFEIVPGVTSVTAVPAYAGIPLTHRDYSSQVTIFTGHEYPAKVETALDYKQLASLPGTKVMLMGFRRIEEIARRLIEEGAAPATPVALVRWGTTGRQQTVKGELHNIARIAADAGFGTPALGVIGDVVRLSEKLNWFEKRPLFGKRVVVTRTRAQAGTLSAGLRELGADVIELPAIRIEPPRDLREFGQLVMDSHTYDWIVFTSVNGVNAFFEMFYKLYDDARDIGGARIAAIGPATAQRVKDFHLKVDLQPPDSVAEAIVSEFEKEGSVENLKFLLARAETARDVLPKRLAQLGAIVDEAIAYRTVPETADVAGAIARFKAEGADVITFTSGSTAENFMALKLPLPAGIKTASIGPITSGKMRELGLPVDIEAAQQDTSGLLQAILEWAVGERRGTGG